MVSWAKKQDSWVRSRHVQANIGEAQICRHEETSLRRSVFPDDRIGLTGKPLIVNPVRLMSGLLQQCGM